jgi:predicted Zn-dependent protease
LSTHPAGDDRIRDLQARMERVLPLYEAADKPSRVFGPPPPLKG